jgi:hypothetical protein
MRKTTMIVYSKLLKSHYLKADYNSKSLILYGFYQILWLLTASLSTDGCLERQWDGVRCRRGAYGWIVPLHVIETTTMHVLFMLKCGN